ncbi:MAG: hypothetical protein MUC42_00575 [Bryobacter sp.]|jgi:hypothetical protein|nr:hypothetical protein [Bryobacter sp.]
MKSNRLSFDLSDQPQIAQRLRREAARRRRTQKSLMIEALESYFSQRAEDKGLLKAAESSFAEWNNAEDAVYDNV